MRRPLLHRWLSSILIGLAVVLSAGPARGADKPRSPNIVFILADDLGAAELGCYGQKKIQTPNVDRMAKEGLRFTNFYAGCAVCAPSRCVLMTGQHTGHAHVRSNKATPPEGQEPIPADTVTIPKLLKAKGYATGACGKWGLGGPGSCGDPNKQGFDLFFGYNCQSHAHNHYPTYLWRNDKKITLDGNDGGDTGKQYSHDLMEAEAIQFIKDHKDKPFFLYVPFAVPHMAMQVPEDSLKEYAGKWEDPPYKGKSYRHHPQPRAAYAAVVTRMDRSVGRILEQLKKLDLDDNTVVMFSSDNGPGENYGGIDSIFFESAGGLRGYKGSVYEGGIRVPFVVRWPGTVKPGRTSDLPAMFCDVLPTMCAIAGADAPKGIDGVSLLPTLTEKGEQKKQPFLYWEFHGYGGQQAVRTGDWKGVRMNLHKGLSKLELYDLAKDAGEKTDVAAKHPDIVEKIERIMKEQHVPSKEFPIKSIDGAAK